MKNKLPSLDYLNEILKLSDESPSGLIWISTNKPGVVYNSVAGTKAKSANKNLEYYNWNICIDKKFYKIHNIIWKMYYGEDIPDNLEIDHIDRDATNNRIENLRLVTKTENAINKRKNSTNSSGYSGVYWCTSRNEYQIQGAKDGKWVTLGYADNINDAIYIRIKHQIEQYNKFCERELNDVPKEVYQRLLNENIIKKTTQINE